MNVIYLFLSIQVAYFVKCAKILAVYPSPGYSQFILAEKLTRELVGRGHEVTVISPYKPKEEIKNYRPILVDGILKMTADADFYIQEHANPYESIMFLDDFGHTMTEYILAHEEVQRLIHSNETFDLVLVEQLVNEAHMGFAPHFKAPLVSFCSIGLSEWSAPFVGNLRPPSVNPLSTSSYSEKMSFFQRLDNSFLNWFDAIYKHFVAFPHQQELLTKYFPGSLKLEDIIYNVSILLQNSHATSTSPSTLTTSVKEIGGFHISPKKLPTDIQKYLDEATNGAIFFSMGTNLKSADLPKDKLYGIFKVFSKLKQRVLWKFEDMDYPNKPKNVFISKWMPQTDILAHPNVVAFITHGGLISTTESIYYGVPMVGIPIFVDQKMNVARSVQKQIAVHIPFKELSETSLSQALKEILTNPRYLKNAQELSSVFNDQIAKPMDVAIFWIEYVIRHRGAPHFRNAAIELYWFQLYLVDVIGFIVISIATFFYVARLLIRILIRKSTATTTHVIKHHKQKIN